MLSIGGGKEAKAWQFSGAHAPSRATTYVRDDQSEDAPEASSEPAQTDETAPFAREILSRTHRKTVGKPGDAKSCG